MELNEREVFLLLPVQHQRNQIDLIQLFCQTIVKIDGNFSILNFVSNVNFTDIVEKLIAKTTSRGLHKR